LLPPSPTLSIPNHKTWQGTPEEQLLLTLKWWQNGTLPFARGFSEMHSLCPANRPMHQVPVEELLTQVVANLYTPFFAAMGLV